MTGTATAQLPEILTTRILDAPPAAAWQAWSEAEKVAQWRGPDRFSTSTKKFDFRTGGEWDFIMHGPDGADYPNHIIFTEISHPQRTFEPHGNETKLTMRHCFDDRQDYELAVNGFGAVEGAIQHLGRLDAFLQSTG
jgi:hypothetical protein